MGNPKCYNLHKLRIINQLDFWKIYKIKYYDSLESLQLPTYIMAGSSKTVLRNK